MNTHAKLPPFKDVLLNAHKNRMPDANVLQTITDNKVCPEVGTIIPVFTQKPNETTTLIESFNPNEAYNLNSQDILKMDIIFDDAPVPVIVSVQGAVNEQHNDFDDEEAGQMTVYENMMDPSTQQTSFEIIQYPMRCDDNMDIDESCIVERIVQTNAESWDTHVEQPAGDSLYTEKSYAKNENIHDSNKDYVNENNNDEADLYSGDEGDNIEEDDADAPATDNPLVLVASQDPNDPDKVIHEVFLMMPNGKLSEQPLDLTPDVIESIKKSLE